MIEEQYARIIDRASTGQRTPTPQIEKKKNDPKIEGKLAIAAFWHDNIVTRRIRIPLLRILDAG